MQLTAVSLLLKCYVSGSSCSSSKQQHSFLISGVAAGMQQKSDQGTDSLNTLP